MSHNHPPGTRCRVCEVGKEAADREMQQHIDRYGWGIIGVLPSPGHQETLAYTIGCHLLGLPELLLVTKRILDSNRIMQVVNQLGNIQRERAFGFKHGEEVSIGDQYPVKMRNAHPLDRMEYTIQATEYYRGIGRWEEYQVMRILLPDQKGIYEEKDAVKLRLVQPPFAA